MYQHYCIHKMYHLICNDVTLFIWLEQERLWAFPPLF